MESITMLAFVCGGMLTLLTMVITWIFISFSALTGNNNKSGRRNSIDSKQDISVPADNKEILVTQHNADNNAIEDVEEPESSTGALSGQSHYKDTSNNDRTCDVKPILKKRYRSEELKEEDNTIPKRIANSLIITPQSGDRGNYDVKHKRFSTESNITVATDYSSDNEIIPIFSSGYSGQIARNPTLRRLSSFLRHKEESERQKWHRYSTISISTDCSIIAGSNYSNQFTEHDQTVLGVSTRIPQLPRSSILQPQDVTKHAIKQSFCGCALSAFKEYYLGNDSREKKPSNFKNFAEVAFTESSEVGNTGGVVCVAGCKMVIDKNSLTNEAQGRITITCWMPREIVHPDGLIMTPTVECTSRDIELRCPYTVTMPTCYSAFEESLDIQIESSDDDFEWKKLMTVAHIDSRFIQFQTSRFSRFRAIAIERDFANLTKNLTSVGFLKRWGKSDTQTVVWYILDDQPHLVARLWLEMFPAGVYERIIEPQTFAVRYHENLHLSVTVENCETKPTSNFIGYDEVWSTQVYHKFEFQIVKSTKNSENLFLDYFVQNNSQHHVLEGTTVFNWGHPRSLSRMSSDSMSLTADEIYDCDIRNKPVIPLHNEEVVQDGNYIAVLQNPANDLPSTSHKPLIKAPVKFTSTTGSPPSTPSSWKRSRSPSMRRIRKMVARIRKKGRKTL